MSFFNKLLVLAKEENTMGRSVMIITFGTVMVSHHPVIFYSLLLAHILLAAEPTHAQHLNGQLPFY